MGAEGRALHSRLPEGHSEQGIRPSLGEQGHCLNKLLFHVLSSCRLGLWSREPVELGVSVLEGPVMFYMAKGTLIQQHLTDAHGLAPRVDPKSQSQDPIH